MKIHHLTQGTAEWHAFRATHRNASEAPAMMGVCAHTSRTDLLRMKSTGAEREFSDWVQEHIIDEGHAVEEPAREIAQSIIGQSLYPATVADDDDYMAASLDGMTMDGEVLFEHKSWNKEKAAYMRETGQVPQQHYWQVQQQLVITGAAELLFMLSDGTREKMIYVIAKQDPDARETLLAHWHQFDKDLAAYVPAEIIPAAVAAPIKDLPAIVVTVAGNLSVETNFTQWGLELNEFIARIPANPSTDQEFTDCKAAVAALKKAEELLDAEETRVLSMVPSIDEMKREKKFLSDLSRTTRLALNALVTAREQTLKAEIMQAGKDALAEHIASLNERLGKPYMPSITADWAGAIKGKKLYASMRSEVSDLVAAKKVESTAIAYRIEFNLKTLREEATDYNALFPDTAQLVLKAPDDLMAAIKSRIAEHKEAEQKRLDAEREKIRAEEEAKAAAKVKAEQEEDARLATANNQTQFEAPIAVQGAAERPVAEVAPTLGQVLHAAAPTEVANIIAPINTDANLKLGEINARIAPLSITAEGMRQLGFEPHQSGAAKVFRECDYTAIIEAMIERLREASPQRSRRAA